MISPLKVANTFIQRFAAAASGIDHMKLQKLVYFVHGWWLAYHAERLLTERPQVWKYGPVFPSLYRDLKIFGTKPLLEPVASSPFAEPSTLSASFDEDSDASQLVDWVWRRYGHLSALALSDLTHRKGTAWRAVAEERNFVVPDGFPLDDEKVRAEFEAIKAQMA